MATAERRSSALLQEGDEQAVKRRRCEKNDGEVAGIQADGDGNDDKPAPAAYDACFGLLIIPITVNDEIPVPARCTPCSLTFSGGLVRVFLDGDGKDGTRAAAIFQSAALRRLVEDYSGTLSAWMCGWEAAATKKKGQRVLSSCTLRIVVYGQMKTEKDVAYLLGDNDLFLEDPSEADLADDDRAPVAVPYFNPQDLLLPGAAMPAVQVLAAKPCCCRQGPAVAAASESVHAQVLRVFDTACSVSSESDRSNRALSAVRSSTRLATELMRHQAEALALMVDRETSPCDKARFPTLWRVLRDTDEKSVYQNLLTKKHVLSCPPPLGGGILADEMGLGKTLSTLALICHWLDGLDGVADTGIGPRATLIVTPLPTMDSWEKQIQKQVCQVEASPTQFIGNANAEAGRHIQRDKIRCISFHGPKRHVHNKADLATTHDVVLTTYETLQADWTTQGPLTTQTWARLVLDEAHKIRNRKTKVFKAACAVSAQYRWCLTGTPIQNGVDDFGALLSFLRLPSFEGKTDFDEHVGHHLKQKDPTKHRTAAGRDNSDSSTGLRNLRLLVAATCLRRTKTQLDLPQKHERVELVHLSGKDRKLYDFFKHYSFLAMRPAAAATTTSNTKATMKAGGQEGGRKDNALNMILNMRRICDHGEDLLPRAGLEAWKRHGRNGLPLTAQDVADLYEALRGIVDRCVGCTSEIKTSIENSIMGPVDKVDATPDAFAFPCKHLLCPACQRRCTACPKCSSTTAQPIASSRGPPSAKLQAILRNLATTDEAGQQTKHVVFSCWRNMLDLLAAALAEQGVAFCRLDGRMKREERRAALERFDGTAATTTTYRVLLATLGAAGEGIDLTAANTVHIVEPQWNPMAEVQAVDRVHRMGQTRDVQIIRYMVRDSIESYVQWVQSEKLRLIGDTLSPAGRDPKAEATMREEKLLTYLKN